MLYGLSRRPACLARLRQYPSEPKPSYITPWDDTPAWEQESASAVYDQVHTFVEVTDGNTAKLKSVIVRSGMRLFAGCGTQSNENARDLVGGTGDGGEFSLPPPRRLLPDLTSLYVRWGPNSGIPLTLPASPKSPGSICAAAGSLPDLVRQPPVTESDR